MSELLRFKSEIYKYALICALIMEILSILIVGIGTQFAYGIGIGTLVSIANFSMMSFAYNWMIVTKRAWISIAAYAVRLCLAAAAILVTLNISIISAFGTLAGLMTVKLAIYFLHSIRKDKKTI
jgi:hypothetical protein